MDARCADSIFFNGRIYTFDDSKKLVRAVAVEDGRIVAVGDDGEIKGKAPRGCDKYDLGGRPVLPGFIDCHTHFIQMGVDSMNVDLSKTRTIDEALSMMKTVAKKTLGTDWAIGAGWKESGWPNGRFITRNDLDESCPNCPAVAHRVCGHLSSVNSKAIELLGVDSKTPGVEVDGSGKLTGILKESAVSLPRDATAPSASQKMKGLHLATKKAHSLGVTSINDNGAPGDLRVYREAEGARKLDVRVWFNVPSTSLDSLRDIAVSTGLGSDRLKIGGVKIFCDGALGARTAAVSEAYADDQGNTGMLVHERVELNGLVSRANEAGLQLAIHAIGDVGISSAISAVASALLTHPRKDHRHRIEHLELPSMDQLREMRKLKIIASMQPNFIGEWGGTDGMYLARLGPKRLVRNNPFREVLASRVKLVFGSDCMPFSPLYGIHSAVNAPHPAQRISVEEAISAYTRDASFASFEETTKGTISVGKFADFAVLSADPFEHIQSISQLKVLKTVLAGSIVYDGGK